MGYDKKHTDFKMKELINFLGWVVLVISVLFTTSVILEIKAKREVYEILTKICLCLLAIVGIIVGILGLLAK